MFTSVNMKKEYENVIEIINTAINNISNLQDALLLIITNLKIITQCDAIGIRLQKDDDYPYYTYDGFPKSFVIKENSLCVKDLNENRIKSEDNQSYLLECMCGAVITGNINPNSIEFTKHGSFYSNNTTLFINSKNKNEIKIKTRNLCNSVGYESIALIPIKSNSRVIGLIQLNDFRTNVFTMEMIRYLEMLGENIGLAIENFMLNDKIKESELIIKLNEQKAKIQEELLINLTHEFKTPLTVINSAIQTMELVCKNELSDKAKGFLNNIRKNSNRQLKLVNNILDITRLKAGQIKLNLQNIDIVNLTRSITESIKIYAEFKQIDIKFLSLIEKKVISLDDEKYERIILNLLSNAIKFTPEGKSIAVKLFQKIIKHRSFIYIKIIDTGIGIPKSKLDLVFERFGQVDNSLSRHAEGAGIGLSLIKMLVDLMGGKILLKSKEGIGSEFTIILPDETVKNLTNEEELLKNSDYRLIQATTIEFSDL